MGLDDGDACSGADWRLLASLADASPGPSWKVEVGGRVFVPDSVEMSEFDVPVRGPGMRGGVYRTGTRAYRVACTTADPSIARVLTSAMLGPSTDFAPVRITARTAEGGGCPSVLITANLVGYVQKKGGTILLNLVITGASRM